MVIPNIGLVLRLIEVHRRLIEVHRRQKLDKNQFSILLLLKSSLN